MQGTAERPLPEPPPAEALEVAGRLILALAFIALAFGLLAPHWIPSDAAAGPELSILPRLSAFLLTAFVAGLVQGARTRGKLLFIGAALATLAGLLLLPDHEAPWRAAKPPDHAPPWIGATQDLGLLQASILSAVLWGTLLARGLKKPSHLLMVVLCASAGDAWLNLLRVPETVADGHPLKLLRLAWPPAMARAAYAPSFTDLLFLALYLETGRRFRFHGPSILFGAVAGYAVATLLSLATMRVMLALPLVSLGVLMGAWPDFRCTGREVIGAFAAALLLFAVLLGLHSLRTSLHPLPQPKPETQQLRRVARTAFPILDFGFSIDHGRQAQGLGRRILYKPVDPQRAGKTSLPTQSIV
ncbi:MAG: hypothetical protein HY291_04230 [Planctomycetes bacterium]|nr:hypothetical protein [Planctomycetota bacterium]